jgi:hypothetical protein
MKDRERDAGIDLFLIALLIVIFVVVWKLVEGAMK